MTEQQKKDAKRLRKRMSKLIDSAKDADLQFTLLDDSIYIGDIKAELSWENLVQAYGIDEFVNVHRTIIAFGG